jgi:hypothetical protein
MSSWRLFTRMPLDRRYVGGVHGGAMAMETTLIPKAILFTI